MLEPLLLKMQTLGQHRYLNESPMQAIFLEFLKIFKNTHFTEHLRASTSDFVYYFVLKVFTLMIYWDNRLYLNDILRQNVNKVS